MAKKKNYSRPLPDFYLLLHDIKTGALFYTISCRDKEFAVAMKGALYRLFHYKLKKDYWTFEVISRADLEKRNAPKVDTTPEEVDAPRITAKATTKAIESGDQVSALVAAVTKAMAPALEKLIDQKLNPQRKAR